MFLNPYCLILSDKIYPFKRYTVKRISINRLNLKRNSFVRRYALALEILQVQDPV